MFDTGPLLDLGCQLAGVDTHPCGDDELLAGAVDLERLISLAQTAQAHVLAELDGRGTTDRVHGMKTVSWVARESGCARGQIRSRLKVGRSLRHHFDRVDDAVADGRLTYDHAKCLAHADNPRISDVLTATQDEIIALAEASTFEQWKRDVLALADYADTEGAEPDPYAGNELHLAKTLDGRLDVSGSFDAANGLSIRTAIEAKTDELFKRLSRDQELTPDLAVPARKVLRALALAELLREAVGAEPDAGAAPRAEVTLVLHDGEVTDAEGIPMPQAATDVWGCDPEVWAVVVDHMGIPVDVGHTKRLATVAQRRAIAIRDGGCTFPGCDAPVDWCDHHHVLDWHKGGPTDLSNLVALCRHHHGVSHRKGWTMTLDDEQVPHWATPSGDHLTGQRHHRRTDTPPYRRQPDRCSKQPDARAPGMDAQPIHPSPTGSDPPQLHGARTGQDLIGTSMIETFDDARGRPS